MELPFIMFILEVLKMYLISSREALTSANVFEVVPILKFSETTFKMSS